MRDTYFYFGSCTSPIVSKHILMIFFFFWDESNILEAEE